MGERDRIFDTAFAATRAAVVSSALLCEPLSDQEVSALLIEHGGRPPLKITPADHAALRAVATRVRDVFAAPDLETAAAGLNLLLAEHARPPRLTDSGGLSTWHLHVHDDGDSRADWFAASSALALATLLVERQRVPGGVCAAPGCQRLFADVGGGMPRRYCSERCATRARVSAFRSRHAAAA